MGSMDLDSLIRILQASISPIAMISGIGLLVLSLTNRFARVTDRLRELASHRTAGKANARLAKQIQIFLSRARIIRCAVSAAIGCMLFASLMVLLLFAMAVAHAAVHMAVLVLFALSLLCLIVTLLTFFWDMRLSLLAI